MAAAAPEEQTLLTVVQSTSSGSPALSEACRAGACPRLAEHTLPMYTSPTADGGTPARSRAALMATAPRSVALRPLRPPMKLPSGVRAADTT